MATQSSDAGGPSTATELTTRQRRRPVFYVPDVPVEKTVFQVPKGTGTRLRDIPSIAAELSKIRSDEPLLIDIHRILFKRTGVKTKRKRDIGDFSGFSFASRERAVEVEKLRERIGHTKGIKKLIDFFGLPVKTGKEKMMDAVVEFLMKPRDVSEEETVPVKKETPKKKTAVKRVTVSRKRKSEETKTKPQPKAKKRGSRRSKKAEAVEEEEAEEEVNEEQGSTEPAGEGTEPATREPPKEAPAPETK